MDAVLQIIFIILNGYYLLMIAYILLSWFPSARSSGIYRQLAMLVEPYLARFRSIIPPIGGLDLSPLLAFLLLSAAIRMLR
jgi:YggT family protein